MAKQEWVKVDIDKLQVPDLATGRNWLEDIRQQIAPLMEQMRAAQTKVEHDTLKDKHYRLVRARRRIQSEMGKIVKARNAQFTQI